MKSGLRLIIVRKVGQIQVSPCKNTVTLLYEQIALFKVQNLGNTMVMGLITLFVSGERPWATRPSSL